MLTNEQINAAIAKQRGEYYENIRVVSISGGVPPRRILPESFPLYTDNWAAAGPLLPDLLAQRGAITLECRVVQGFRVSAPPIPLVHYQINLTADMLTEAIARAYHAAFCKEE